MNINDLAKLMVEHGLIIRAIPHEHSFAVEVRHKDRYPNGVEYYDERCKRPMLKVVEKNRQGGKFIITAEKTQGSVINYWGKPSKKWGHGTPTMFYDSVEQAVTSFLGSEEGVSDSYITEIRRYACPRCSNKFWVDCDDTDYPDYCPFCGEEIPQSEFIKSAGTNEIQEV